jgi:LAGLIDADG DNA endonuclease family
MEDLCIACNFKKIERRGLYCFSCYVRLMRHGKIIKLKKPIMPNSFSLEQEEIIVGSLLGDGCIFKYKPTHKPYFCIVRKDTDDKYLIWEYEKFKEFCISEPTYRKTFDKRTNEYYKSIKLMTRRTDLFEPYYNLWYPKGKKIVPNTLSLSPLSLAIWFCDDGNVSPSNSPWRMRIKLATHGFSPSDVEFLQFCLQNRYSEKFSIVNDDKKLFIIGSDNATRAFLNEIDPVFPDSMLRKAYWKNPEANFYTNQPTRSITWK